MPRPCPLRLSHGKEAEQVRGQPDVQSRTQSVENMQQAGHEPGTLGTTVVRALLCRHDEHQEQGVDDAGLVELFDGHFVVEGVQVGREDLGGPVAGVPEHDVEIDEGAQDVWVSRLGEEPVEDTVRLAVPGELMPGPA